MAYIGSLKGPRDSDIISRVGPGYFGITPDQLEEEIDWYADEESRGVIKPAQKDEEGRYFVVYSAPEGKTQRYYLDEYKSVLEGVPA